MMWNKAERGIIFIDEIDKIAKKKNTNTRGMSAGNPYSRELLKLLRGSSTVEVPVGAKQQKCDGSDDHGKHQIISSLSAAVRSRIWKISSRSV